MKKAREVEGKVVHVWRFHALPYSTLTFGNWHAAAIAITSTDLGTTWTTFTGRAS